MFQDPSAGPSETRSHSAEQEVGGSSKNDVVEHSAKASDNPGKHSVPMCAYREALVNYTVLCLTNLL